MLKRVFMGSTLLILLSCSNAFAQSVCPLNGTSSGKLVCVIPQVYGPSGLGSGAGCTVARRRPSGSLRRRLSFQFWAHQ